MSKFTKLLFILSLLLIASLTAVAEPAALGPVGTNAPEARGGNITCADCAPAAVTMPGSNGTLAGGSTGAAAPGVEPFGDSPKAGRAVLNGGDMDGLQNGPAGPVPEPSTVALLGAGLAALVIGLRRRG